MLMKVHFMFYLPANLPVCFKIKDGEDGGSKEDWYLVEKSKRFCLPKTMLFLGRDECDVVVQSQSVDKRHAVVTYDHYLCRFKIKDLSTAHGTYVNESRIPEQEYVTLNHMDSVRLGFDTMVYHVEKGSHVPHNHPGHTHHHPTETLPGWAAREGGTHFDMAECEVIRRRSQMVFNQVTRGCIAEQQIQHTCVHQTAEPNFVDMHRSFGKKEAEEGGNPGLGSNTWPRKRLRQGRHHPHVASVFADAGDQADGSMTNNGYEYPSNGDGSHHSSCEHAGHSDPVHDAPCMCYSRKNADYLDYAVTRIPRSGSRHQLPPELETVKKCTPLYGQPDWWGEEEGTDSYPSKPGSKRSSVHGDTESNNQADRPRSLSLEQKEALSRMEKSQGEAEYGTRYMEIPYRALESDREKETPPRSMSSSISKDSLFSETSKMNTPDTPGDRTSSKEGTPDRGSSRQTDTAAMAFTVDFGDDDKKTKMPKSLSECVPSKMRKSFRERKDKVQQRSQNKEATPSKSEEEREMSPAQTKKQDDTASSSSDTKPVKKHSSTKKTEFHGSKKLGGEKSPSRVTENGESSSKSDTPVKGSRAVRSKKSPSSVRSSTKSPKSKPSEVSTLDPSQYRDPASFLIDKMFEGNGKGSHKPVAEVESSAAPLTEHDLYKESAGYDVHAVQNGDANSDLVSASNLKSRKSKDMGSPRMLLTNDRLIPDKKDDDKASEAGTYTIEVEEECGDEDEARRNIDRVFGVDPNVSFERPVIDVGDSDEEAEEREVTESLELAQKRAFRDRGSSMEVEAGSADTMDDLEIPDDIDLETFFENQDLSLAAMSTDDVPKWVSQWAALAKQRALKKSQSLDLEEGHNNMKDLGSQKPPNVRKRPGTGRKLPSIPTDQSPCSSDYSPRIGELSPRSGDATPRQEDPLTLWPLDSKQKSVTISSQVVTHYQETNGDSSARGRSGSGSDMSGDTTQRTDSPASDSAPTNTSMDTEVLLRDTVTVMAAMEARMANRETMNGYCQNDTAGDSDSDSLVAMVNGDDKFVKPTTFSSPRDNLGKRSTTKHVLTSTPKKPPLGKSLSVNRDQNVSKTTKPRSYSLDTSGVSDVYSESSELGDSESYRSDVSSDNVGSSAKKEAKKGLITNTKPNRAFALRRAKADGPEETPRTNRSRSSTGSTPRGSTNRTASSSRAPTASSVARSTASSTARSTARSKSGMSGRFDSGKSEVSLGAEIVKKSRENIKSSSPNFDRKDGGRHSLRSGYKTNSQKTLSIFNPVEAARRSELKVLKTQLKKTEGSRGLSVTGNSARSQSQPGSRSNSPKAAERLAWKRRKEYDPRKAVASAKAKAKDVPKSKPLPSSQSTLAKKRMYRSASFTNSAELSGRSSDTYRNGSVSSVEDLSLTTSEATDSFDEQGLPRAFIPLSGPLRRDRISHSADEDDTSLSLHSSQDISRGMLGSAVYKSAFTPPPPKLKSPSVATSPLPTSTLSSRRRTLDSIEYEENHSRLSGGDSPQSYDTLLITSIYQLSLKLKTSTDRTLNKLREHNRVSATPSPIDDFLSHSGKNEIPAWKSANQELAGILKNLRKIEHHQQVVHRALFPDEDSPTEVTGISSREKQKYFKEIERIRNELADFRFIDKPECEEAWKKQEDPQEMSPDMEEIGEEEFY
ncbi:centrosomal protein of 170 kDa-like isoform X3 [Haliotis rufescens]|uniref:centrosomal protein of 170 kDa-like isoform X3 n=1 Tax=Haliotis rufescens TaxID=6454 RepID=UPI00201EC067|nr:centrosomal protein of 170 kDa-like isoform X3 [Haliotis rufescens]